MKKNAFTLIELVSVVLLLGLITLLAFPPIINQIKKSNSKIDEATEKLITIGTSNYLKSNKDYYPEINGAVYCIKLQQLIDNDNLSEDLKNSDGNNISKDKQVMVKVSKGNYKYTIVDTCQEIRKDILKSRDACIVNNQRCSNGTKVNVKVNDTENYDFYVIADTGTKLTLIMDRNLGNRVAWISQTDYVEVGGTAEDYGTYGNVNKGPLTALNYLESQTVDWTNIPIMSYTLNDDGGENQYGSITRTNVRARLASLTEIDNLSDKNTTEQPHGYWLSAASAMGAYNMNYGGSLDINDTNSLFGVRPVISISKDL